MKKPPIMVAPSQCRFEGRQPKVTTDSSKNKTVELTDELFISLDEAGISHHWIYFPSAILAPNEIRTFFQEIYSGLNQQEGNPSR